MAYLGFILVVSFSRVNKQVMSRDFSWLFAFSFEKVWLRRAEGEEEREKERWYDLSSHNNRCWDFFSNILVTVLKIVENRNTGSGEKCAILST